MVLEKCTPDCIKVGNIESLEQLDVGHYEIKIKGLSGEMIPRFYILGKKMKVHDYNAVSDKWEDQEYLFTEGAG